MAKEVTLPSGNVAVISEFKGKQIREAQRLMDGDTDKYMFALISVTTTINNEPIVIEDLDEMDGRDVLVLMNEFGTNFTSPASK